MTFSDFNATAMKLVKMATLSFLLCRNYLKYVAVSDEINAVFYSDRDITTYASFIFSISF